MTRVRCSISVSVDGYVAGPNQSLENAFGEGVDDRTGGCSSSQRHPTSKQTSVTDRSPRLRRPLARSMRLVLR
jgi:hypothetical protein